MRFSSFFLSSSLFDLSLRFFWSSPNAFVIEFCGGVSPATSALVFSLERALVNAAPLGVAERVPAFTTLTLSVDWRRVKAANTAINANDFALGIERVVRSWLAEIEQNGVGAVWAGAEQRIVEIPVCYAEECAPDAAELVARLGFNDASELARLHAAAQYTVAMIGFTPGFPYLLGLPRELSVPRKSTPRARVEAGSVGVASAQTGVYPFASPGGWNIIGRTPLQLFCADWREPSLLRFGDLVRFIPISLDDFHRQAEREARSAHFSFPRYYVVASSSGDSEPFAVVLRAGVQASIQDGGRAGYRAFGVPESGAADRESLFVANILAGNPPDCAALECMSGGFALRFEKECLAALAGADCNARLTADGKSRRVEPYRAFLAPEGSELRFANTFLVGARAYLAVAGGVDGTESLGSRSAYPPAQMGGFRGAYLKKGDALRGQSSAPSALSEAIARRCRENSLKQTPRLSVESWNMKAFAQSPIQMRLRYVRGAEWEDFSEGARRTFALSEFVVLPESNRMGVRLRRSSSAVGEAPEVLTARNAGDMISRAVFPGTVQVPPDGNPILLLADAQTTGGYPVIASVIPADIPKAAQIQAGDTVVFEEVGMGEALRLGAEWEQSIRRYSAAVKAFALG